MVKLPLEKVKKLKNEGKTAPEIASRLTSEGYTYKQVDNAMQQQQAGPAGMQPSLMDQSGPTPAPTPTQQPTQPQTQNQPKESQLPMIQTQPVPEMAYSRQDIDEIEALVESVVEEKWHRFTASFGDLNVWREKIKTDTTSIKQEILRMNDRFENLQKAVLGKITEYDKDIIGVTSEIKALEKVMQRITKPLTTNIKELEKLTKKLKT